MSAMRPQPRNDVVAIPVGALRRLVIWLIAIAIIAVIAAVIWQQKDRFAGASAPIDKGAYQSVFLVTNQVYFGKLQIDGDNYLLTDVFYLSQPADPSAKGQLVKRGNELHGPKEPMVIPSRSVLFMENMRDDSEVVTAIKAFKAGGASAPAPTPAPAAPAAPTATAVPASPTGTARPSATR